MRMLSLVAHALIGVLTVVLFFYANAYLYRGGWEGTRPSWAEGLCYALATVSVCVGWYFNQKYVFMYGEEAGWLHFIGELFATPAGGSGAQDLLITNVVLFPLWTMIDGPRRGLRWTWIYFVMSCFTSFAFAMALYLAAQERQVRWLERPASA
jgi:hypothetical protein